jgi:hypothetical protein
MPIATQAAHHPSTWTTSESTSSPSPPAGIATDSRIPIYAPTVRQKPSTPYAVSCERQPCPATLWTADLDIRRVHFDVEQVVIAEIVVEDEPLPIDETKRADRRIHVEGLGLFLGWLGILVRIEHEATGSN